MADEILTKFNIDVKSASRDLKKIHKQVKDIVKIVSNGVDFKINTKEIISEINKMGDSVNDISGKARNIKININIKDAQNKANELKRDLFEIPQSIADKFKKIKFDNLLNAFKEMPSKILSSFNKLPQIITSTFKEFPSAISSSFKKIGSLGTKAFTELGKITLKSFKKIFSTIGKLGVSAFKTIAKFSLSVFSSILSSIGKSIKKMLSSVIAFTKESIQAFGDFEQGMKNIEKSAGGTQEELKKVGDELRKAVVLDLKGTKTVEDLQLIAAEAGKFGIAAQDLGQFTVSISKISTLWGLSAASTGESVAKIIDQYKLTASEVENVGSVVDGVADSYATSEKFLLNFSQRTSGIAKATGQTLADVLAMGARIATQTGMKAQAGSSAYSAVLNKMLTDYDTFASAMGMSSEQLKQIITTQGADAFNELLLYLGRISQEQGPTAVVAAMKDLGLTGLNVNRLLLGMIGTVDGNREAMDAAAKTYAEGTRVSENFGKSIDTQNAGFSQLPALIKEVKIAFGEVLAPTIRVLQEIFEEKIVPVIMDFVKWLRTSEEATQFFKVDLPNAARRLGELFVGLIEKAKNFGKNLDWSKVFNKVNSIITSTLDVIEGLFTLIFDNSGEAESEIGSMSEIFKEAKGIVLDVVGALMDIAEALLTLSAPISALGKLWNFVVKGVIKSIKLVVEGIGWLVDAITGLIGKILKLGDEAFENSVFPDMAKHIEINSNAISALGTNISKTTQDLSKMDSASKKIRMPEPGRVVSRIQTPGQNMNAPLGTNLAQQRQQTQQQEQQQLGGARRRGGVQINFNGTNIVDESSKDRFARQIGQKMIGLNARMVSV